VREPGVFDFGGEIRKAPDGLLLFADDVQPAQPFVLIFAGPERRVLSPEPRDFVVRVPVIECLFDSGGELGRQREILQVDVGGDDDLLES